MVGGIGHQELLGHYRLSSFEQAFLNEPSLLQLQGKRQLGVTRFLFSSATHTRFEHSIGAGLVARVLADNFGLSQHEKYVLQAAAFLHDAGHRPSSHNTDDIVQLKHEEVIVQALRTGQSYGAIDMQTLQRVFHRYKISRQEVASVIEGKKSGHPLSCIITNDVVDVDRIDFLLRDLVMCGVGTRPDTQKIIDSLTYQNGTLGVSESGADSVIHFLSTRSWAYKRVYHNPDAARAQGMLQLALRLEPYFGHMSPQAEESLHRMSDDELFGVLGRSTNETVRSINERLHGPRENWYAPVYELKDGMGSTVPDIARKLHANATLINAACKEVGLANYWFKTGKRLQRMDHPSYPTFPVSNGTDLFDIPAGRVNSAARANFDDYPTTWLAIYGPKGNKREKRQAERIVGEYA